MNHLSDDFTTSLSHSSYDSWPPSNSFRLPISFRSLRRTSRTFQSFFLFFYTGSSTVLFFVYYYSLQNFFFIGECFDSRPHERSTTSRGQSNNWFFVFSEREICMHYVTFFVFLVIIYPRKHYSSEAESLWCIRIIDTIIKWSLIEWLLFKSFSYFSVA